MTHAELVARAVRWLRRTMRCGVIGWRPCIMCTELPDAIGWRASGQSFLVEAKCSRGDFKRDAEKWHRQRGPGMGNGRWFIVPQALVAVEELPEGWGLLQVWGARVREQRVAQLRSEKNAVEEMRYLLALHRRGGDPVPGVDAERLEIGCLPDPVI